MMKKELQNALYDLLALEYNCSSEDFEKDENILTVSKIID